MEKRILSIDPGRDKVGVAVLSDAEGVLFQGIFAVKEFLPAIKELAGKFHPELIILGDRTGSKQMQNILNTGWPSHPPIHTVDEHLSSEEGRRVFLRKNPARGLRKFLPLCLRSPERPYDDYVAVVLGERFLSKNK